MAAHGDNNDQLGHNVNRNKLVIADSCGFSEVDVMVTQPESLISKATHDNMRPERIGHRLKLLRLALGLGKAEIADLLDIERTYWSRFEGGKRSISDSVAVLLVERFGVTLDFLILGRWETLPLQLAEKMRALEAKNTESKD